eukprot:COSAG01_NODE_75236_length_197_cov_129.255102_1_plen_55_part_10
MSVGVYIYLCVFFNDARPSGPIVGPACSSACSRMFLIDQGHSSQNQVRNPLHIQM